eukprot:UN4366
MICPCGHGYHSSHVPPSAHLHYITEMGSCRITAKQRLMGNDRACVSMAGRPCSYADKLIIQPVLHRIYMDCTHILAYILQCYWV